MLRFKPNTRPEAKTTTKKLATEYGIDDPAGVHLLLTFADCFSLELAMMEQIDHDGLMVLDRFGQQKPNPLLAALRDCRAQKLAALKALNIDLEPLNDRPGRPCGR